jgi:hypothetical protein
MYPIIITNNHVEVVNSFAECLISYRLTAELRASRRTSQSLVTVMEMEMLNRCFLPLSLGKNTIKRNLVIWVKFPVEGNRNYVETDSYFPSVCQETDTSFFIGPT